MNNENNKIVKLKEKIENINQNQRKKSKPNIESSASFGFKISTELVAALIIGVGMGLLVDNYLGTKPIGLIIFFILGAFAGFLNVYRIMRRIEKQ